MITYMVNVALTDLLDGDYTGVALAHQWADWLMVVAICRLRKWDLVATF
jgi:hypothetical protein